ncbi:MAG: S-layer homology domain-containing protein, partial [Clostridia bacterium]|nr:S-layer homology domain-containing protein [Clostridia bacterium]
MKITKAICLMLAALILSAPVTAAIPAGVGPFSDVKESDWFAEDVLFAERSGLMRGVSDGLFLPNAPMTRAMFVTVIWRDEGAPAAETASPFTDVYGDWYKTAVEWGFEKGLVKGKSDISFAPDDLLTREELVTFVFRYAVFRGDQSEGRADLEVTEDQSSISEWAREAMAWAFNEGIITGEVINGKVYLVPFREITRGEAAAVLKRFVLKRFFYPGDDTDASLEVRGIIGKCRYYSTGNGSSNYQATAHSASDIDLIISDRRSNLYGVRDPIPVDGTTFVALLKSYGDDFFENSSLFVAFFPASSGSNSYSLKDLKKKGSVYSVAIDAVIPEIGTDDMAEWCVIAEIPEKGVDVSDVVLTAAGAPFGGSGSLIEGNGLTVKIDAVFDSMPKTDVPETGKQSSFRFTVTVKRAVPNGKPIPDFEISVISNAGSFKLVDCGEKNDERRYRLLNEDCLELEKKDKTLTSGTLIFKLGDRKESVRFSAPLQEVW